MSRYVISKVATSIPIFLCHKDSYATWLERQTLITQNWLNSQRFLGSGYCVIPDSQGQITAVILGVSSDDFWCGAQLATSLPQATYHFHDVSPQQEAQLALVWALQCYRYDRYKKSDKTCATLAMTHVAQLPDVLRLYDAIALVRDLINAPTEVMGPAELSAAARQVAAPYKATVNEWVGEQLLQHNFPLIHAVGRASAQAPRLIEMLWGDERHPRLTLLGKGVCFDSGGLDIKPASGMRYMKKDMGGAAHVLGLAQLVMAYGLRVRLHVLIPAVENAISGASFRPGDVFTARNGTTVEIGNTDAEGRLVLADAFVYAGEQKPDLMLDFATLTGAARVALGTDIPALFCNDDAFANSLQQASQQVSDPLWRLPLYQPYAELIKSPIADISNESASPYAGALTAALFLERFVPRDVTWAHLDLMAYNLCSRAGRPEGGEAMALRAVWHCVMQRYKKS